MLTIDVLESLVIPMQNKWPRLEIMTPMSQSPHNGIKLFVIGVVVAPRAIKLLT